MRFVATVLILLSLGIPARAVVPFPSEADDAAYVRLLDGTWHFKLEQSDPPPAKPTIGGKAPPIRLPDHPEPFERPDYVEDATWKTLAVPGNWEIAGFAPATFHQPDNDIGLYRQTFDVPADWQDKQIFLNFDGVNNGAEIYLNGQPVNVDEPAENRANYHEGGFDAFQVDLTPAVKFGQPNLLAVRVYKNTRSVDLDTGDFFFLGGIERSVTLFAVSPTHVQSLAVRTHLLDGGKAELRLLADITSAATATVQLEGSPAMQAATDANGHVELVQTIDAPRLWSAEHPNLYNLSIDVRDAAGTSLEHLTKRIGLREVTVKDGVLLVNNVPVKLAGMCRHDCYPTVGSALTEDIWRRDLLLMRAANVNGVRTSHYPYGSKFYDLCDELGFYVADEMAACWTPTDTDALTPAFARHARELVRRDLNHPSVILWAIGNENKPGKNNVVAAEEIRMLDPTLPRLVSNEAANEANVELDDKHYSTPAEWQADIADPRRATAPKIYMEQPNVWDVRNGADVGCLDAWAAVIDRVWQPIWADDHLPGAFLWEWADRAVADQFPTHLYDYDPATGINLAKVKGIVDGYRNPRPTYYQVKMVYAPVKVSPKPTAIAQDRVTVHVANHYSFTDLSELTTTWHLLAGEREVGRAAIRPSLAPRSDADIQIALPSDAIAQADALRLDFARADGGDIATYDLPLKPATSDAPQLAGLDGIAFPRVHVDTVTYAPDRIGWHWATRHGGTLVHASYVPATGAAAQPIEEAALYALPLARVRSLDADIAFADQKPDVAGHVHVDANGGRFAYTVAWTGSAAGDIQELGWSFAAPATGDDHFSWHRKGYWSYYPQDHIGRLSGTATPDSADVHISRFTRPDAFDFNSTKYGCDWAALTDASGIGIAAIFDPADRQQCKGSIEADGSHRLVVNQQVSPPRDLSSSAVPDLYLKLKKGDAVSAAFRVGTTSAARPVPTSSSINLR